MSVQWVKYKTAALVDLQRVWLNYVWPSIYESIFIEKMQTNDHLNVPQCVRWLKNIFNFKVIKLKHFSNRTFLAGLEAGSE